MQGMLGSNLPPGMRGFLLAQQQNQQKEAQALQMAGMLAQLQGSQEDREMKRTMMPLQLQQLQAQVAEANTMGQILQRYMQARGTPGGVPGATPAPQAIGALSAGAEQGDIGPTVTNAARMPAAPMAGNPMQLPPDVEMALLHPRLKDLGKVQAEAFKPTDAVREAIQLGFQPGSPQFNAYVGTKFNQGGAWQVNPQGGVNLAQGYASGMGEVKGAEERARAGYDLITVPPTSPNSPPTFRSRLQALDGAGAAPPAPAPVRGVAPTDQAAIQQVIEAERRGQPVSVTVPQSAIPTARVVGNAAGMSPNQEADLAASKKFKENTATDYAKLYGDLNKASMQNVGKIAKFERIGQLLGDFEGGKLSQAGFELARLGNSVGVKLDPRLPNKEAAEALSKEVALDLRSTSEGAGMPGALSDADREFLRSMTPQMASTADGRKQIIQSRVALWKREMQVAEMARKYTQKYGQLNEDFFSQLQTWSNGNPVFK